MRSKSLLILPAAAMLGMVLLGPQATAAGPPGGGHSGGGHSSGGHSSGGHTSGGRSSGGHYSGGGGHYSGGGSRYYGGRYSGGRYYGGRYYGGRYYGGRYWGGYYPFYWGAYWGWPYWGWYGYGPYGYGGAYARDYYYRGQYAVVDTDVSPDEAEVWLNGTYIGSADDFDGYPDYLYLEPGKYSLEFKLAGYDTYKVDLDVKRGEKVDLDKKLVRQAGHGKLDSFAPEKKGMPYGRVFGPDGKPVTARDRDYDRDRSRGEIREEHDDDEDQGEVRERDDRGDRPAERPRERFDASRPRTPDRARLKFQVMPEDAAVYLDDRYVGAAEEVSSSRRGIVTDPGKHTVTVMRPGYAAKTIDVEAKAGTAIDVVVELEK